MTSHNPRAAGAAGLLCLSLLSATAAAEPQASSPAAALRAMLRDNPGVAVAEQAGRISKVYGSPFSTGGTAQASAESFRLDHAGIFGVPAEDLVAVGPGPLGTHVVPIMYRPETDTYKFTGFFYTQQRDGVPVYGTALKLIVRNEPGFPLVLASANLRDLGAFRVPQQVLAAEPLAAGERAALDRAEVMALDEGRPQALSSRRVIWAGGEWDEAVVPRLADETLVAVGEDRWAVLTDAVTGEVLDQEHRIHLIDLTGIAEGKATEGIAADFCESEVPMPLPYLNVFDGTTTVQTDVNGEFSFEEPDADPVEVSAMLNGTYFDVFNFQGSEVVESETVVPPGPANLLFNEFNNDELVRAQVNGYVYANKIRDFVLSIHPSYPVINFQTNFDVNVNRIDGVCPGNAWYNGSSINHCLSAGALPNTAWSSVIYHEYGHHIVQTGGSGQCQYGEGMADVMSVLILDSPLIGLGFFGSCTGSLRHADNTCQYSETNCTTNCGGPCHNCGRLLSGCVWSTRNNLIFTEPDNYIEVLASLALNSVLLHVGESITPQITIDWMTLDDDDGNLLNGTPHYVEIQEGFSDHGMPGPEINLLDFQFPEGLPALVSPEGGTTVPVDVASLIADPQPGTGSLFADVGIGFVEIPMTEIAPNEYEAVFPESTCAERILFYFSAETTEGDTVTFPQFAPSDVLETFSGAAFAQEFADDFELDMGWVVSGDASDGQWERGVPITLDVCDRGNPGADGDGSGQCYLTDNDAGNCNSDVDGGATVLSSPVLDASEGLTFVRYLRWYDNSNTPGQPFEDVFEVEVSNNAGADWIGLETVGPDGPGVAGGWFEQLHLIEDTIPPTDQFQIRFVASDEGGGSVIEAAVDGVELLRLECEAGPLGDLDGDGIVGIVDFLQLLGAWGPCPDPCPPSCVEDLDDDCEVGILDFLLLLANWST